MKKGDERAGDEGNIPAATTIVGTPLADAKRQDPGRTSGRGYQNVESGVWS